MLVNFHGYKQSNASLRSFIRFLVSTKSFNDHIKQMTKCLISKQKHLVLPFVLSFLVINQVICSVFPFTFVEKHNQKLITIRRLNSYIYSSWLSSSSTSTFDVFVTFLSFNESYTSLSLWWIHFDVWRVLMKKPEYINIMKGKKMKRKKNTEHSLVNQKDEMPISVSDRHANDWRFLVHTYHSFNPHFFSLFSSVLLWLYWHTHTRFVARTTVKYTNFRYFQWKSIIVNAMNVIDFEFNNRK